MSLPARYVRRPAAWGDLDAVVELYHACDRADADVEDPVRQMLEEDWHRTGFDFDRHSCLVVTDAGRVAAHAEVFGRNPELSVDTWVRVHPDHRGRGLGAALLTWAEERADKIIPRDKTPKIYNSAPTTDRAAWDLLVQRGYEPVRVFWHMERDLSGGIDDAQPVAGVTIRPFQAGDPADADAMYHALEGAFAEHWGFEPFAREAYDRELERRDQTLIWFAVAVDEVVGVLTAVIVEGTGWIDDLGVRKPWRRRGIGRSLLLRSFAALAERGLGTVMLNVDSTNTTGATHVYESVGMRVRRAWNVFEKPLRADVS